jgi:hypothetical protein
MDAQLQRDSGAHAVLQAELGNPLGDLYLALSCLEPAASVESPSTASASVGLIGGDARPPGGCHGERFVDR